MEALLAAGFATHAPEVIGNDYYVIGTVERKTWRQGMHDPATADEVLHHAADFEQEFDLHYEPGRWHPEDRDTR